MKGPRNDLVDNGQYQPKRPEPQVRPQRTPTFYDGRRLADRTTSVDESYYDLEGRPTEEPAQALAKRSGAAHFIKFSTAGADRGRMVDPRGLYFEPTNLARHEDRTGKDRYEYREVSGEVFRSYLHYLVSRDTKFLREAERVVRDA